MQAQLVAPIPMWGTFSILQNQLRSYGQTILALFEELKATQGENEARMILDQEMTEYRTQSDNMRNGLVTTIEEVWTELAQRLNPPPSTVSGPMPQYWMGPNPNSMSVMPHLNINGAGSEYAGFAAIAFEAHPQTLSPAPDTSIPMPQPIDSSLPAMGPPSILGTNPEVNGDVGFTAHPQTSSLPPGAPGHVSGQLVTLEWPTDRTTRVRVVEATSEVLISRWPATLVLQAIECSLDIQKFQDWMKRVKKRTDGISEPSTVRFRPAFEEDQDSFDRLIEWLRHEGDKCYAAASWEILGNGRPTQNLILRPCMDGRVLGLLGAVSPVSGMPVALPGGAGIN